jgi:hypothetical protein
MACDWCAWEPSHASVMGDSWHCHTYFSPRVTSVIGSIRPDKRCNHNRRVDGGPTAGCRGKAASSQLTRGYRIDLGTCSTVCSVAPARKCMQNDPVRERERKAERATEKESRANDAGHQPTNQPDQRQRPPVQCCTSTQMHAERDCERGGGGGGRERERKREREQR